MSVNKNSKEPVLTFEAKEAVRNYVLSLLILPASLIGVGSFALGFFINEVARGTAYTEAYSIAFNQVSGKIVEMTEKTTTAYEATKKASDQAKTALDEVEKTKYDLKLANNELTNNRLKISQQIVDSEMRLESIIKKQIEAKELYEQATSQLEQIQLNLKKTDFAKIISQSDNIVSAVSSSPQFQDVIVGKLDSKINRIDTKLSDISDRTNQNKVDLNKLNDFMRIDYAAGIAEITGSLKVTGKLSTNTMVAQDAHMDKSLRVGGGRGVFFLSSKDRISMSFGYGGGVNKDDHRFFDIVTLFYELDTGNAKQKITKDGF